MLIVKLFGGSSVADKERIFNVANRCIEDYEAGNDVVVVLSAMGKTTDRLIEMARDINPKASKREMDMLLATGEQTSVALMSMAMQSLGVSAVSLNAFQVVMHTTSAYSNAKFKRIDTERIFNELEQRRIVIITGFQGVNKYDDITTLGPSDVEGVYTADPRVVPNAKKLKEITYDEMLELATLGAKVLHNRSVELAKKYGVQLVVRSSLNRAEGTIVKEETEMEGMLVSGVAVDKNAARIAVIGIKDEPGMAFKVFDLLAKKNINVDIILQSIGRDGTKDISFTVSRDQMDEAVKALEENHARIKAQKIEADPTVAKLSIVGAGMQTHPGVAAGMFEALYNIGVNIRMIGTSEIRVTVLVDEKDVDKAMRAAHDRFIED